MPATGTTEKRPPFGLKIVSDENVVTNARIYALIDGEELDISRIVQKVDVKLHVGELATANLQVIVYSVETRALLDQLEVKDVRSKLRWWKKGLFKVTNWASRDGAREYVR